MAGPTRPIPSWVRWGLLAAAIVSLFFNVFLALEGSLVAALFAVWMGYIVVRVWPWNARGR